MTMSIKHDNDYCFTYDRCTNVCYRFKLIKAFVINVRFRHEKLIYDTRYQTIRFNPQLCVL